MKIEVAGAGAGKTTSMVDTIVELRSNMDEGLIIFCIAFTNTAVECIKEKIVEWYGYMPENVIVSTIHSFLYREFIKPYNYLLYKKHYERISIVRLSNNPTYKNIKISQLDSKNILHQNVIPERAKWLIYKKSKDNKNVKNNRNVMINTFKTYCGTICVDEAQDINDDMLTIIKSLNEYGVEIRLVGDPKQDVKGNYSFRQLIDEFHDNVEYNNICYRCPQKHLLLSNSVIRDEEKQSSVKVKGDIRIAFESDKELKDILEVEDFDLKYISARRRIYETHMKDVKKNTKDTLFEEISIALEDKDPYKERRTVLRESYRFAEELLNNYHSLDDKDEAIRKTFGNIRFDSRTYARLCESLLKKEDSIKNKIYVSSIEAVKGDEGENCLFILTPDLSPYLFGDKIEENKTKNQLYVALTRSLKNLTIYITKEVEEKTGKKNIVDFFKKYDCIID